MTAHCSSRAMLIALAFCLLAVGCAATRGSSGDPATYPAQLEHIRLSDDGAHFVLADSGKPFIPWGFNYTHDASGRLVEEFWETDWAMLEEDFREMKALGANVVRIHLQTHTYVSAPGETDEEALQRLSRLLDLAKDIGIYLDITGLSCYHKRYVPEWYSTMNEAERWATQVLFWEAVARTCADSPAVFCYDLMNEPVLPGAKDVKTDWLTGELSGKHFVQYISLDLAGRSRTDVARAWTNLLAASIRKHDPLHLITVGVINWTHKWPKAKPIFYAEDGSDGLDFVSVHIYPKQGEIRKALDALDVYDLGRPLVIEETYPMNCSSDEIEAFMVSSRTVAEGWITHYFGRTVEDYAAESTGAADVIHRSWFERAPAVGRKLLKYPAEE
ncbi:MAG: cellulase family glycosylhydrolase [bacterium]|nr:cellulase family glycosylhydrolase [bacterium]